MWQITDRKLLEKRETGAWVWIGCVLIVLAACGLAAVLWR
jgi:hypothetical protein